MRLPPAGRRTDTLPVSPLGEPSGEPAPVAQEQLGGLHHVLFELAPDGMITTDHRGRILQVNSEAEKQFGYQRDELIGQNIETLIPERFRRVHESDRAAYQAAPISRPMNRGQELFGLRKNGTEFPVDISLSPVRTDRGMLFFCIIRDISDRLLAMQMARNLRAEQAFASLSAKFINLPSALVDREITHGLQVLVESLDTDQATLGQIEADSGNIFVSHVWVRADFPAFTELADKRVLPWLARRMAQGEDVGIERIEDLPPEAVQERDYLLATGMKSCLVIPFRVAGKVMGEMSTGTFREHRRWEERFISRFRDLADIFANALARKQADEGLQKADAEIRELKDKLEREVVYLREEIKLEHTHSAVVGNSAAIRNVLRSAEQVAPTDSAVLILGETGTGKELIASAIHDMSARKLRPMVKINCAALPGTLIESELFGREKGAYTGALAREIGRFEVADKSTIFLDEIGELPLELQSKLLRVLQEGEFERLGSPRTVRVDVRVIAATNRDLQTLVKEGKFRQDLFYRLNVFPIVIPPLRERREDIPALVWHTLKDLGKRMGRNVEGVHAATMRDFQRYSWPGNVRELRNVMERNLILNSGPMFRAELPDLESDHNGSLRRLDEVESNHLLQVLQMTRWRIRGRRGAAEILGLKATTLEARMKKLGIHRPA